MAGRLRWTERPDGNGVAVKEPAAFDFAVMENGFVAMRVEYFRSNEHRRACIAGQSVPDALQIAFPVQAAEEVATFLESVIAAARQLGQPKPKN